MRKITILMLIFFAFAVTGIVTHAQIEPMLEVNNQFSADGTIIIERVVSDGPGFIVIHAKEDDAPGAMLGYRSINAGENVNFHIPVDFTKATPILFAMLHYDNSVIGEYEYKVGQEGIDGPLLDGAGNIINPFFEVSAIVPHDQFVENNQTFIDVVVTPHNSWLVVHTDDGNGMPGAVLGATFVEDGLSTNVPVTLDGNITDTLFPMLHEDTGEEGQYEFGRVQATDGPVVINDVLAVATYKTIPNIVARQQIVMDTFVADSVLSDGPGWLVIHTVEDGDKPSTVIGAEFVNDGFNKDVTVSLNLNADITAVLFPMLHKDTGEIGKYEFGTVDGVDTPVTVNGDVVTFPMLTKPSFTAIAQPVSANNSIRIATALIDAHGWLVIHADNGEGAPGNVLGYAPLLKGFNQDVEVILEGEVTDTVFPMLHYDTDEMGVYEFGQVNGADLPVTINGDVIVGSLEIQ